MRLTPGELIVMGLLWQHGEATAGQLLDVHPEEIKNAALRSYLTILVDKGHVSRRRVGKAYIYQAITPEKSALSSMVHQLADAFFDGSIGSLAMNLISREKLSDADLKELRKITNQPKRRSGK